MRINDKEPDLVKEINKGLKDNVHVYGKPYCPCVPPDMYLTEMGDDFICPCKNFRCDVPAGETCHCGKFIKEEKDFT